MIKIIIGTTVFTATFFQNASSNVIKAMLPLTLNMSELNKNEKYFYLTNNPFYTLSTNPTKVEHIKAGEIMLYGNNCLVLFYKSFKTSYSYTRIGQISDTTGLIEALGGGDVTITFERK